MNKTALVAIIVVVVVVAGVGGYLGYQYTHPVKTNLPKMYITALSPLNALATFELDELVSNYKALGLPISISLVSPTVEGEWLSPTSTPQFVDLGWLPDWPDPIAQQMWPMATYSNGGAYGANMAWVNNTTLNSAFPAIVFNSNKTQQMQEFVQLYKVFYDQYSYIWLPNPDTYFFVQPYITNFTYNAYENYYYNMMNYSSALASKYGMTLPSNGSGGYVLNDAAVGDSLAPPDYLDPSHGFFVQDGPMFTAAFQQLYELNGTNYEQVVPVIAQTPAKDATNTSNPNTAYRIYNIELRSNVYFDAPHYGVYGSPTNYSTVVNATTVWFSLYRTIVMAQGVSVDNYAGMLFNASAYAATAPYSLPWGWMHAMRAVANNTSLNSGISFPYPSVYSNLNVSNTVYAANYLANMLSHFDPWSNATQAALLSYPNQALYVPNYNKTVAMYGSNSAALNAHSLNVTIKLLKPYPFFLQDMAEWWGNIADPAFIDTHDGVLATAPNNYTDANGMPGTGPYYISGVGSSLSTVTLTMAPNYWGKSYWSMPNHGGLPAMAQPAHIGTVVMDFTIDHSGRVSGFLDNTYQISVVSSSYLGSIIGQGPFKTIPLNDYFHNFGANPAVFYISMNNYLYPTNNTYFRMALWYGTNYSALNSPFYYTFSNGTKIFLAQNYIGPISPGFANFYDNATKGLQPPTYNITLAEHYLNIAGQQEHFFVTLPNGTKLGDVSSSSTTAQIVLTVGNLLDNMLMAPVRIF